MSVTYNGAHSVAFVTKSSSGAISVTKSWDDLFLIPAKRLSVTPSKPNYAIVSIPGSNQSIDVTLDIPKALTYGRRSGNWEFYVDHDHYEQWHEAFDSVKSRLNGNKVVCVLMDDPGEPYSGRVHFTEWRSESVYSTITVDYTFDYKYDNEITLEEIENYIDWDEASTRKAVMVSPQSRTAYPKVIDQVIEPYIAGGYNYLSDVRVMPISYQLISNSGGGQTALILSDEASIVERDVKEIPPIKTLISSKIVNISGIDYDPGDTFDDGLGDDLSEINYDNPSIERLETVDSFPDEIRSNYYPLVYLHSFSYSTTDEIFKGIKMSFDENEYSMAPNLKDISTSFLSPASKGPREITVLNTQSFGLSNSVQEYIDYGCFTVNSNDDVNFEMSVIAVPNELSNFVYFWNGSIAFSGSGQIALSVGSDVMDKLRNDDYYPVVYSAFSDPYIGSSNSDPSKVEVSFDGGVYEIIANRNYSVQKTTALTNSRFTLMSDNRIKMYYRCNNNYSNYFRFLIFAAKA